MYLRSIEIKNYRSLEDIKIESLGKFNVLIGRNNAGKSSVFGALAFLTGVIWGENVGAPDTVLTDKDTQRALYIRLVFEPNVKDREEFVDLLISAGHQENRRVTLLKSSLLGQIEFQFKSAVSAPQFLHLREIKIQTEDNKWAVVQQLVGEDHQSNPTHRIKDIYRLAGSKPDSLFNCAFLDLNRNPEQDISNNNVLFSFAQQEFKIGDQAIAWMYKQLGWFLKRSFFFNPFRHSTGQLAAHQNEQLSQDGANLAQVLHTINSNNRPKFSQIEQFIQAVLPDVGTLQTPLLGSATEISFISPVGNYAVRLHDMGGGIEQLLMVATVLLTTGDESTIFLEEPESHLHAGAQRFLLERLYHGNRQVFITTHSPIFVNLAKPRSMYQVVYSGGRTTVTAISDADSLSATLEDIGVRNSDVLLSDAVLFVEGPSDRDVFTAWSEKIGSSLSEHNVTILPMRGGEHAERHAPIRSEVLAGISQKAPVPHIFVLDRDERRQAEVGKLQKTLGGKAIFLNKREVENYLLIPKALLAAMRTKYIDESTIKSRIDAISIEAIDQLIRTTADSLYGIVLLKRIRAEIAGLPGGFLSRDSVKELAAKAHNSNLANLIKENIESRLKSHVSALDVESIVRAEKKTLDGEWAHRERHLELAPGEEMIMAVFQTVGGRYDKATDAVRIAREMEVDEIHDDIKKIIKKTIAFKH